MRIVPLKSFLYSLDGIRPSTFVKGVEVSIPTEIADKLLKTGGYITDVIKNVTPTKPKPKKVEEVFVDPNQSDLEVDTKIIDRMLALKGIEKDFIQGLVSLGLDTPEKIINSSVKELIKVKGIGKAKALIILSNQDEDDE